MSETGSDVEKPLVCCLECVVCEEANEMDCSVEEYIDVLALGNVGVLEMGSTDVLERENSDGDVWKVNNFF